jgi:peptide/nickel transport system ATP-binding protein
LFSSNFVDNGEQSKPVSHVSRERPTAFRVNFELDGAAAVPAELFGSRLPDGEAGRRVSEAIGLLVQDRWDEASDLLRESFTESSICAREEPYYEIAPVYGSGRHVAACHLHRQGGLD